MSVKSKIITILLLLSCIGAVGQNYLDIASLEYTWSPTSEFEDGSGSTTVRDLTFDLTTPIPLNDRDVIISGLVYEENRLELPYAGKDIRFGYLLLKAGYLRRLNDRISAQLILLPRIATDIGNLSGDGFQMGILGQVNIARSEYTTWKFAGYFNDEFFGPLVIPFFGMFHRKDKFHADLFIPAKADFGYYVAQDLRIGAMFRGRLGSMLVSGSDFTDSQYVNKLTNEVGVYAEYRLNNVVFLLNGGTTIGRYYRIYNRGDEMDLAVSILKFGDDRTLLQEGPDDSWFIKGGIKFRVTLD